MADLFIRRFVYKWLLFNCKWVGYRVRVSVSVTARARVSARVTVRDRDRI